jgi:hypothetical protein
VIGNIGLSYAASETTSFGASLGYRHPTASGFDAQITASPWVSWRLGRSLSLTTYGYAGLTASSPDYGVGIQLSFFR